MAGVNRVQQDAFGPGHEADRLTFQVADNAITAPKVRGIHKDVGESKRVG